MEANAVMQYAREPLPPPENIAEHTRLQEKSQLSKIQAVTLNTHGVSHLIHLCLPPSFMSSMRQTQSD